MTSAMILLVSLAIASRLQALDDTTPDGCVIELFLPKFPPLARQAKIESSGVVAVTVGARGEAESVESSQLHGVFRREVEASLKRSRFDPRCSGRKVELSLTFKIAGKPVYGTVAPGISFKPPNGFVFSAPPSALVP